MTELLIFVVVLVGVLALAAGSAIRVLREYERAVVFRLGRFGGLSRFFNLGTWVVAIGGAFVLLIYSTVARSASRRRHPAH